MAGIIPLGGNYKILRIEEILDDLISVVDGDFMIFEVNCRLDHPRLSNMCLLMMTSVRG